MTDQHSTDTIKFELSPAARAVLTAVTLTKYDVPPEGLPAYAIEMAPLIAAALRAIALYLYSEEYVTCGGSSYPLEQDEFLVIADELEDIGG